MQLPVQVLVLVLLLLLQKQKLMPTLKGLERILILQRQRSQLAVAGCGDETVNYVRAHSLLLLRARLRITPSSDEGQHHLAAIRHLEGIDQCITLPAVRNNQETKRPKIKKGRSTNRAGLRG